MDTAQHWWMREGYFPFEAGNDHYPHSGQVIQYYRIRKTIHGQPLRQSDCAKMLGISERALWAIENRNEGLDSFKRRLQVASLLAIPPSLLKLDAAVIVKQSKQQRPGQVVKEYRKKKKNDGKAWTQGDLAELMNLSEKAVQSLENHDVGLDSVSRRELLITVLGIPPALLGLDALHLVDKGRREPRAPKQAGVNQETITQQQLLLSTYWDTHYTSSIPLAAVQRSIAALHRLIASVSQNQQEEIRNLLCRFHQLALDVARDQGDLTTALVHAGLAIIFAENIHDDELLAAALYRRGLVHFDAGDLKAASEDLQDALPKARYASPQLQGMVYMEAARFSAYVAQERIEKLHAEKLLDHTQKITYGIASEGDEHHVKLDKGRFHIGKAATLLALHRPAMAIEQLEDAKRFTSASQLRRHAYSDILCARAYYHQGDYDAATTSAFGALQACLAIQSESNIADIARLSVILAQTTYKNAPQLVHLGLVLQSRK